MTAGGVSILLEGNNITIIANTVTIKSGQSSYGAGNGGSAELKDLPQADNQAFLELNYHDEGLAPVSGAPYKVIFSDGSIREGKLDNNGYARLEGVPVGKVEVYYGESDQPIQKIIDDDLNAEIDMPTDNTDDDLWGYMDEQAQQDVQKKLEEGK